MASFGSGGMRRTHTAANLIGEMQPLNIGVSVLLPIDYPILSNNAANYLQVAQQADGKFVSFGSVHPHARNVGDKLAEQQQLGAKGIKVHPAVQLVAPDHPRAMKLYRYCGELGLPVLWHCGPVGIEPLLGRYLSQLKHYWRPVHDQPDTTFILGHSGALQRELAIALARDYGNVYLDIACQSLTGVRQIIAEVPPERILFGTDWPFYHQSMGMAKVLIATEGDPVMRQRILWDNAARLLQLPPRDSLIA